MGKPAVSLRYKLIAFVAAGLLACGVAPFAAYAVDEDSVAGPLAGPGYENDARSASPDSDLSSAAEGPTLASTLAGTTTSIVSADVTLDSADPVVGSFTVDGLTYAVGPDGLTLVAVGAAVVPDDTIAVPATVTYSGITYDVTAVGPYAFYLSGATSVELPASVVSVDDRVFRSSDVGAVSVDPANPNLTSFDGALYSADLSRLLLIPEGRKGSVLLSCETEVVEASLFSHCSLVEAISVEEGGAAFSSWDGLLYDAAGTTLLRVPAGATDITIRDGCTSIAAGAMEGCASLERINAPASIVSISPDVFASIPTVALPAQMAVQDEATLGVASALADQVKESADFSGAEGEAEMSGSAAIQLTAMVALLTTDEDLPEASAADIEISLSEEADAAPWERLGFRCVAFGDAEAPSSIAPSGEDAASVEPAADIQSADGYQADTMTHVATVGRGGNDGTTAFAEIALGFEWAMLSDVSESVMSGEPLTTKFLQGSWARESWPYVYVYSHSKYGYAFKGNTTPEYYSVRDKATHRRLKAAAYRLEIPSGCTVLNAIRSNPVTLDDVQLPFALSFDPGAGIWDDGRGGARTAADIPYSLSEQVISIPQPTLQDMVFLGWYDANGKQVFSPGQATATSDISQFDAALSEGSTFQLFAHWKRIDFDIGFDVDSEPGDEDYKGEPKDDQEVNLDDGHVVIEDPKRLGYVFEGWVIPNAGGTEAVDQELVYQGDDGKWYVDASKLPDYAGDDGRVELTARWTSVISVDVPSSVTFYADLVTQGQQSREGAASGGEADGASGQNKFVNQSQVDLRVVGLESSAAKTTDSTLGADSVLKKVDAATPSTSTQKLLSLYPSTKQWTADELRDPDAVGGDKAATAVDFDLDDILLEKSFSADDFTIAAGDTLNMGYRLNLAETGQQLDYDRLSTLQEGQSAAIANVSYCFSAEGPFYPLPEEPQGENGMFYLYLNKTDASKVGLGEGYYATNAIKYAARSISEAGTSSVYYAPFRKIMENDIKFTTKWYNVSSDNATDILTTTSPYDVRLVGILQDYTNAEMSSVAGLTFQFANEGLSGLYRENRASNGVAWRRSEIRARMNSADPSKANQESLPYGDEAARSSIWNRVPKGLQNAIEPVYKLTNNEASAVPTLNGDVSTTLDQMFLMSYSEMVYSNPYSQFSPYPWIMGEGVRGGQYDYWKAQYLRGDTPYSSLIMRFRAGGTQPSSVNFWWERSRCPINSFYLRVGTSGQAHSSDVGSHSFGIVPCFAL